MNFRLGAALLLLVLAFGAALYLSGGDDDALRLSGAAARIAPGADGDA